MTIEEMEKAFALRLPVVARVDGISCDENILEFRCISAIKRRWSNKLGREVQELELLDKNRQNIIVVPVEDVFLKESSDNEEDSFFKCQRAYERYFGMMTPVVCESIDFYLREGMEANLIIRIIEYSYEQGKRSWSYLSAILMSKLKNNIKTLDEYNRAESEWAARMQRKGQAIPHRSLSNYKDSNKPDYSNFAEKILKEMLRD